MSPLADDVGVFSSLRAFENFFTLHHHAHVNNLVVITSQHDADDVLADVMDVALHRSENDFALAFTVSPRAAIAAFSASMNGVRYATDFSSRAPTSRPAAKHFARAEQIADDAHASHQRPSMTASGLPYLARASSVSASM